MADADMAAQVKSAIIFLFIIILLYTMFSLCLSCFSTISHMQACMFNLYSPIIQYRRVLVNLQSMPEEYFRVFLSCTFIPGWYFLMRRFFPYFTKRKRKHLSAFCSSRITFRYLRFPDNVPDPIPYNLRVHRLILMLQLKEYIDALHGIILCGGSDT